MADIEIDGVIYTTDRLTCYRVDGEYQASIDNYYHARGFSADQAVKTLAHFMRSRHGEVFAECEHLFDEYFKPVTSS